MTEPDINQVQPPSKRPEENAPDISPVNTESMSDNQNIGTPLGYVTENIQPENAFSAPPPAVLENQVVVSNSNPPSKSYGLLMFGVLALIIVIGILGWSIYKQISSSNSTIPVPIANPSIVAVATGIPTRIPLSITPTDVPDEVEKSLLNMGTSNDISAIEKDLNETDFSQLEVTE